MKKTISFLMTLIVLLTCFSAFAGTASAASDLTNFDARLAQFKTRYPHNSTYVNDLSYGGYECFGFANELAWHMFGRFPTDTASADVMYGNWTRAYGGAAVDNLQVGDVVRFYYHSIFITGIYGDNIYYAQANDPSGTNRISYDNYITRSELRAMVNQPLLQVTTPTLGWVAHFNGPVISPTVECLCYSVGTDAIGNPTNGSVAYIYSGHSISYSVVGSFSVGATVYVSKTDGIWAHVTCNGVSGYALSSNFVFTDRHTHTNVTGYEAIHPHRIYNKCSLCGDWAYTGKNKRLADCSSCWYTDFDLSETAVSLSIGQTASVAATINYFGPSTTSLYIVYDSSVVSVSIGKGVLTFKGLKTGTTNLRLEVYSDKTKTHLIGSKTISVSVHSHTYSNVCDATCNICNAKRSVSHSYQRSVTKATLTQNGSIVQKCSKCGWVASNYKETVYYPKTIKLSTTSYTYNGTLRTPSVIVKDSAGKTLKKGTDYTVTYASGRKNAGTYKVTVTMKGKYRGTKTLYFTIKPISISKCTVKLSTTSYTYNSETKTPNVVVKNANGTTLKKGTHYTVSYASGRKNVGTYKVTVKMKGNYSGTKTLYFKILPSKTKVLKLTPTKTTMKAYISRRTTQVSGYQIQYSTSKKFTNAKTKTISGCKTESTTLTGLKSKTTYYVRIRTYKKVGDKTYYSLWSSYTYKKTK